MYDAIIKAQKLKHEKNNKVINQKQEKDDSAPKEQLNKNSVRVGVSKRRRLMANEEKEKVIEIDDSDSEN